MPKAYSNDLRYRIILAKNLLLRRDDEIAASLFVSSRTVRRIRKRLVRNGTVSALKTGRPAGSTTLHLHEEYILMQAVLEKPDLRLHELAHFIEERTGSYFSLPTLSRELHRRGFTNKKVRKVAAQRREDLREQYRSEMQNHAPHELIFIDETGIDMRHISRETGYAVKGKRPEVRREMTNNQRISVISVIGYDGYLSVCVLQPGETVTGDVFAEYLRNDIVPLLNQYTGRSSNSIVVLADNHRIHHVQEVAERIYGAGALLRYLPPYSPDLNPIEGSYNQAKHFLKENNLAFRHCLEPTPFILHAFGQISPDNCEGYYHHCGYV
ncbi:hypothetical protein QZH41_008145 [Actinostola sp. cb2023]|nr:hypothetical protein QZH41_008145 [Actinostola sp. cb2023]